MDTDQDTPIAPSDDLLYTAWTIIANAAHWNMEDPSSLEWRAAAIRWRDRFHDTIATVAGPEEGVDQCNVMMAEPSRRGNDPYLRMELLKLMQSYCLTPERAIEKAKKLEKYLYGEEE